MYEAGSSLLSTSPENIIRFINDIVNSPMDKFSFGCEDYI